MKEVVVLYSGGTDSTCAAALMAERFDKVHLLTFARFGVFSIDNSAVNVKKLKDKFGENKFVHKIINIDRLFRESAYSKYLENLRKYNFFLLFTCGLCKLTMHIRALVYCLENNIAYVCDGANKSMADYQEQMQVIINEFKKMYSKYGIIYDTPVFESDYPENIAYAGKIQPGIIKLPGNNNFSQRNTSAKNTTTGEILQKMGIFKEKNIKGTKEDRHMQGRCFQLVLFNIFALWYYLSNHSLEEYRATAKNFIRDKIEYFDGSIREYLEKKDKSRLIKLL